MKHKKSLLAAILVVILLASAVSGTIAYLKASTQKVVNKFTPAKVDTKIEESFTNGNKSSITVKNSSDSDAIPAYVRVAIVGNWCDEEGKVVEAWNEDITIDETAWEKHADGFYYYKKKLPVGSETENLLKVAIASTDDAHPGLHLEVTVMQQAIQSEPKTAVTEKWGVNPTDLQ